MISKLSQSSRIALIILNWNGWNDTIECLESIYRSVYTNYRIIVIDNGSNDNSIEQIKNWASGRLPVSSTFFDFNSTSKPVPIITVNINDFNQNGNLTNIKKIGREKCDKGIVLIETGENLGFSGGMNVGIKYVLKRDFDFVLLLNNDVVLKEDTLENLMRIMIEYPEYKVATPNIYYYHQPNKILNSGGRLTFTGNKKYYHLYHNTKKENFKRITFASGCALLINTQVLKKFGILTENFFHGEEDFDFSLRMKQKRMKMVCVTNSHVYHKVGQSVSKLMDEKKKQAFIYFLNRFVNQKKYFPTFYWKAWRYLALSYILPMLFFRYHLNFKSLINFAKLLLKYSKLYNRVSKEIVSKIQEEGI